MLPHWVPWTVVVLAMVLVAGAYIPGGAGTGYAAALDQSVRSGGGEQAARQDGPVDPLAAVRSYRSVREVTPVPRPSRVRIPAIELDEDLIELGLNEDRTVQVPSDFHQVSWFGPGVRPGAVGTAAILGHVDSLTGPAVFARLHELAPGDEIHVDRIDGSSVTFVVTGVEQHAKDEFPTEAVWFPSTEPALRLITCGGEFDFRERSYRDNLIVFAELAE